VKTTSLAAVLYVQIADFDQIMQADNARALGLLKQYIQQTHDILQEHEGEIVDTTADELLIIFNSAVHAVQFALHLQMTNQVYNRGCGNPDERFQLAIGIHLGEIWRDESRVYGNGINIGARVKQAAQPGMILVSEDVERQVANKLDVQFTEYKTGQLKNIERPLRLYVLGDYSLALSEAEPETEPAPPVVQSPAPLSPGRAQAVPEAAPQASEYSSFKQELRAQISQAVMKGLSAGQTEAAPVKEHMVTAKSGTKASTLSYTFSSDKPGSSRRRAASRVPALSADDRLEKYLQQRSKAVFKMVSSLLVGAALGWAYYKYNSAWWFMAAGVFGLLPFLSGIKRLSEANAGLRQARKDLKRQS